MMIFFIWLEATKSWPLNQKNHLIYIIFRGVLYNSFRVNFDIFMKIKLMFQSFYCAIYLSGLTFPSLWSSHLFGSDRARGGLRIMSQIKLNIKLKLIYHQELKRFGKRRLMVPNLVMVEYFRKGLLNFYPSLSSYPIRLPIDYQNNLLKQF